MRKRARSDTGEFSQPRSWRLTSLDQWLGVRETIIPAPDAGFGRLESRDSGLSGAWGVLELLCFLPHGGLCDRPRLALVTDWSIKV